MLLVTGPGIVARTMEWRLFRLEAGRSNDGISAESRRKDQDLIQGIAVRTECR